MEFRRRFFTKLRTRSSPHQVRTRALRFVMRSVGRNIQKAFRSFAPRRSCNYCSATSVGRAAESWPCVVTHQFKVRPTFRRSTILCPVICQCRAAMAAKRRCAITWRATQGRLVFGIIFRRTSSACSRRTTARTRRSKTILATVGSRRSPVTIPSSNTSTTWPTEKWKACLSWARTRRSRRQTPDSSERHYRN